MTSRPVPLALVALALAGIVAGCAPTPASTPTPTSGFASDAEAFAAAEETYRAYVDALNRVDLSDPETFEDVYAWTTGDANAGERRTLSQMHSDGWVVDGETVISGFVGTQFTQDSVLSTVKATVCSDVEQVTVTTADGESVVPGDRPNTYTLNVTFDTDPGSPTELLISSSTSVEGGACDLP